MKIIVCAKQVPDTADNVAMNPDGTLNRSAMPVIMNPDDAYALDNALRMKKQIGARVIVLSMGPASAESMLREALAKGADEAYLVTDRAFGGSDTYATSHILAAAVRHIGIDKTDLILCGHQAIDGDTAQVGPQLAEKLGLPQITGVKQMELHDGKAVCWKKVENGYVSAECTMPLLVTLIKGTEKTTGMDIEGIYRCYEQDVRILDYPALSGDPELSPSVIGLKGSPTKVLASFSPKPRPKGVVLEGASPEALIGITAKVLKPFIAKSR